VRGFLLNDFDFTSLVRPAIEQAAELLAEGRLHAPIAAIYPLSAIQDAVAHAHRGGKVLLKVSRALTVLDARALQSREGEMQLQG